MRLGGSVFDAQDVEENIRKFKAETENPEAWQNPNETNCKLRELKNLERKVEVWADLKSAVGNLTEVAEVLNESEVSREIERIEAQLKQAELALFLSGKYDGNDVLLSIHAGAGGTDAQDFAEMLLKMYLKLCERKNWKTKILEKSVNEEAGIKSVTVQISGEYAFGWLKSENGVHRLVRRSPFNAGGTRETSFAQVEILPIVDSAEFKINEKDLRVDTYRSGGKGGQSVNTTDSAVRITHLPTGLVVTCQNERSQIQNKQKALEVLSARLAQMMEEQEVAKLEELRGEKKQIAWSNQIRSYVLHPYKLVKDYRTGTESGNPEKIFAGELDEFLESGLKKH